MKLDNSKNNELINIQVIHNEEMLGNIFVTQTEWDELDLIDYIEIESFDRFNHKLARTLFPYIMPFLKTLGVN